MIPVTEVERSNEGRVELSIAESDLARYPAYRDYNFELVDDATL